MMMTTLIAAGVGLLVSAAPPGPGDGGTPRERQEYRTLTRQLIKLDREYQALLDDAFDEARSSESGEASMERRAEILNLRDERDRVSQRLQLLALRHGWDLPSLDDPSASTENEIEISGREQIFAPASGVIATRAQAEALSIAERIPLPLTPVVGRR
ncbi:MAG: hypothetical protein AAFR38_10615 [Planctomycetota bacterium]